MTRGHGTRFADWVPKHLQPLSGLYHISIRSEYGVYASIGLRLTDNGLASLGEAYVTLRLWTQMV